MDEAGKVAESLTANQASLLHEIADGYGSWRAHCRTLAARGLVYWVEYSNGPHAEMTDLGHDVVACLNADV